MRAEHSRALLLAGNATGLPPSRLERRLEASTTMISVDPDMPLAILTARLLVATLRRGPGRLVLMPEGLAPAHIAVLEAEAAAIDPERPLHIGTRPGAGTPVHIHVGTEPGGRDIRIAPEGYGAHIVSGWRAVIRPRRSGNGLGAVYTAALGAAEVFKRTAGVINTRRVLHRHLRYCPVSLSTQLSAAPDIGSTEVCLTLLGVGAIGTGIALALSQLPVEGRLLAVDRQRFAVENRGTYSLGGAVEVASGPWKTDLARTALPRFDVHALNEPVEHLPTAIDTGLAPWHPIVLAGLDSPDARRQAQRLWPDRLIDGATGDTMLGICDYRHGIDPCMNCLFPPALDQPSGAEQIARQLGLPPELLARGETVLSEEHLARLDPDQRRVLDKHVGKPVCGLAAAMNLTGKENENYAPSVPFISLQAACLSVGRLIAHIVGLQPTSNFVQYDGLIGPQVATIQTMRRVPACQCISRAAAIEQSRTVRLSKKDQ